MIYYRVKPEKDNVPKRKKGSLAQDGIYVGNELYTETEWRTYTHRGDNRTRKRKTQGNILVLWRKIRK